MSHEELNAILDRVGEAFEGLKAKEGLKARVEKWRLDAPVITLTWGSLKWSARESESLMKSIHARVITAKGGRSRMGSLLRKFRSLDSPKLLVEINAWHDDFPDRQKKGVRYWNHRQICSLEVTPGPMELDNAISTAFKEVTNWTKKDLPKHAPVTMKERYSEPLQAGA